MALWQPFAPKARCFLVEHVHVHAGGQAVVAIAAGGGVASENQRQPHAKALTHAPVAPLWSENPDKQPVPLAGDAEREVPDARGKSPGAPKGKANGNYRHGRFTREAIERRRVLNAFIRMCVKTAEEVV